MPRSSSRNGRDRNKSRKRDKESRAIRRNSRLEFLYTGQPWRFGFARNRKSRGEVARERHKRQAGVEGEESEREREREGDGRGKAIRHRHGPHERCSVLLLQYLQLPGVRRWWSLRVVIRLTVWTYRIIYYLNTIFGEPRKKIIRANRVTNESK